jgi:hypothetical protein
MIFEREKERDVRQSPKKVVIMELGGTTSIRRSKVLFALFALRRRGAISRGLLVLRLADSTLCKKQPE